MVQARLFEIALEHENRGETETAAEFYDAIEKTDPDYVNAQINLGRLRHLGGDLEAAERLYRIAIELRPSHAIARFNLGVVLEERGDAWAAMNEYRESLRLDRYQPDVRYNLCRLHQIEARRQWMARQGMKLKGIV